MVIDTYVELLASDRALLVPILGSLADMPLDYADKNVVIDATQVSGHYPWNYFVKLLL